LVREGLLEVISKFHITISALTALSQNSPPLAAISSSPRYL